MKRILGIGNALVDALYPLENEQILQGLGLQKGAMQLIDAARFEALRGSLSDAHCTKTTGGSACNTILALARLGASAGLVGRIGRDDNGRFFHDSFVAAGVEPHLMTADEPTGVASTFITPDGERTFGTFLGAAALMRAGDLASDWYKGYSYIYIEGYLVQNHALIARLVDEAHRAGLTVCLDLASYNIVEAERDFFAELLQKTDIVFANEEEAKAFAGCPAREALDVLAQTCRVAVVKVGAEGALAKSGADWAAVSAEPVSKVVDTTAAGDYFAAGFLYAHAAGRPLADCLAAGAKLAAEVIKVVGTRLTDDVWQQLRHAVCHE